MPLDRRITLMMAAPGHHDDHGEWVPGALTTTTVWATLQDVGAEQLAQAGGTDVEVRRDYVIRWRADVAAQPVDGFVVQDGNVTLNVLRVIETPKGIRRRMHTLECQKTRSAA